MCGVNSIFFVFLICIMMATTLRNNKWVLVISDIMACRITGGLTVTHSMMQSLDTDGGGEVLTPSFAHN